MALGSNGRVSLLHGEDSSSILLGPTKFRSMMGRIVPDSLREREPLRKGKPIGQLSKDLLAGKTWFETKKINFGSFYTLARNHGMVCKTKRTKINDEVGVLVWFEKVGP